MDKLNECPECGEQNPNIYANTITGFRTKIIEGYGRTPEGNGGTAMEWDDCLTTNYNYACCWAEVDDETSRAIASAMDDSLWQLHPWPEIEEPEPTPVEVRSRIRYADEVKSEREAWGFDKQELVAATKNVRSAWAPYYEAIGKLACNNDVMYFEVVLWDEQGRAFAEHAQYNARRKEV